MFKKLAKQLKSESLKSSAVPMSLPVEKFKDKARCIFLKSMSKHALDLYERKTDINNFTKLVLSDPENVSHNELVKDLLADGEVVDLLSEESFFELSENKRFLDDLGL